MSPKQFGIQFASGSLAALLAAFLLSQAGGSLAFVNRVGFVAVLGVFVGLVVNVPYWNWYGFPPDQTLAAIADHTLGWGLAGLVLAAIVKSPKTKQDQAAPHG